MRPSSYAGQQHTDENVSAFHRENSFHGTSTGFSLVSLRIKVHFKSSYGPRVGGALSCRAYPLVRWRGCAG